MDSKARQLLGKANEAREIEQDYLKSLEFTDQALITFQQENDPLGIAETEASRAIVFKLLYRQTSDHNFLLLAESAASAGVNIAKASNNKEALALPLFELAKIKDELGNFSEAVSLYQEAIDNMLNNPPQTHNRMSVINDMKVHLATSEYKTGDKQALNRVLEALSNLEKEPDISKYNQDAWVSGAYMRLADILKDDDPEKSRQYLYQAKEIIDNNPELKIRLSQWEKLKQTIN
ncbi:MAG: hypothetical protein PHQ59_01720 [Candidatus Daviesbacteria bacterium]|nr:hypothetical protein [Candidatus Daviesbacteria bacterium]